MTKKAANVSDIKCEHRVEAGLKLKDFRVFAANKELIKGVDLELLPGKKIALFGQNGAGKTSLLRAISGVGGLTTSGEACFNDVNLTTMSIDQRARAGIGLVYQEPLILKNIKLQTLIQNLPDKLPTGLEIERFLQRGVNVGLSGGEKKRLELAQILALKPKLWLIDEIDSGVDQGNLDLIGAKLEQALASKSALIISHSGKIFDYLKMDLAVVMKKGRIVAKGDFVTIYQKIKKDGYGQF